LGGGVGGGVQIISVPPSLDLLQWENSNTNAVKHSGSFLTLMGGLAVYIVCFSFLAFLGGSPNVKDNTP